MSGPFGEQDDQQVFVQKVVPETDQLFIRLSSSGKRLVNKRKGIEEEYGLGWCGLRCRRRVWALSGQRSVQSKKG